MGTIVTIGNLPIDLEKVASYSLEEIIKSEYQFRKNNKQ